MPARMMGYNSSQPNIVHRKASAQMGVINEFVCTEMESNRLSSDAGNCHIN